MIGVHGLLSYLIAQRTHEIGVRVALGATRRDVARVVAGGVLTAVGGGALAGVAASLWLASLIEPFLFGVGGRDPQALGAALGLLVLAAIAGVIVPVRRATRVDPLIALRAE
jgi:putative ABC transport system permease protein